LRHFKEFGMSVDDSLQLSINELRARNSLTWQEIGDLIGISKSLAWRVAHGKCDSAVARHFFGLPQKMVEVLPCVVCGGVHVQKTCTAKHGRKRYRVALEFDTKEEAALAYNKSLLENGLAKEKLNNI